MHDWLTSLGQPTPWDAFKVAQDVPTQMTLETCLEEVRNWVKLCDDSHRRCRAKPSPTPLPRRVLDVGVRGDQNVIRLVETRGMAADYMTLSHCWGKKEIVITTKATLQQHKADVPWSKLSRTFQDAISITRELGVRYLWIDSMCIVQDDEEDWRNEAARMQTIYALSYLNIAATGSADGDGGCFSNRWTSSAQVRFPVRSYEIQREIEGHSISVYARRILINAHVHFTELEPANAEEILNAAPLLSRAWVMQERFMSPRTVHFHSAELVWECDSTLLCECGGLDDHQSDSMQMGNRLKSACAKAFKGKTNTKELGELWFDVVALYSRLKLTKESDRLAALAGLAYRFLSHFEALSGNVLRLSGQDDTAEGEEYLLGLWRQDLPRALLWQACPSICGDSGRAAGQHRLATWSWVSVQLRDSDLSGFITYETATYLGFEPDPWLRVIDAFSKGSFVAILDQGSDAKIVLRGAFISTTLFHDRSPDFTSSFLVADRDETVDTVLVNKEDLIVDVPLHQISPDQVRDGQSLHCLLIGHTTRDMARDGQPPELFDLSLALKQSASIQGSHERVGILQSRQDEDWFHDATESTVSIV